MGALISAYMNVGTNVTMLMILYFLFQFVSMCCAMCLNLYMSESYSTEIRNTGTGVVIAGGRCSVAISQQIVPYLFAAWSFSGVCGYIVACVSSAAWPPCCWAGVPVTRPWNPSLNRTSRQAGPEARLPVQCNHLSTTSLP